MRIFFLHQNVLDKGPHACVSINRDFGSPQESRFRAWLGVQRDDTCPRTTSLPARRLAKYPPYYIYASFMPQCGAPSNDSPKPVRSCTFSSLFAKTPAFPYAPSTTFPWTELLQPSRPIYRAKETYYHRVMGQISSRYLLDTGISSPSIQV